MRKRRRNRTFSRISVICLFVSAIIVLPFPHALSPSSLPETLGSAGNPSGFTIAAENSDALEESAGEAAENEPSLTPRFLNHSVENYIEYFKTSGRVLLQSWLDRSARYEPLMREIFREKNLPEDLVYIAMIESGFNTDAQSQANAVGPWQFIPSTAKAYGLRIDRWVDERRDPLKSTRAAAEHLKDLYNLFGSWSLALASYNAGAVRVQRVVLRAHSKDFRGLKVSRYIPKETKHYVPKFMAVSVIAKDPEAYGFTIPKREPFTYDEVEIEKSTDLLLIARFAGCAYKELKELNPELKLRATPPDATPYLLRLPKSAKQTFVANFAATPQDTKQNPATHTTL